MVNPLTKLKNCVTCAKYSAIKLHGITKLYCNYVAFVMELIAIATVNIGIVLELKYCQDLYLYLISFGSLLFGTAAFFQKKLPWALTRWFNNKQQ